MVDFSHNPLLKENFKFKRLDVDNIEALYQYSIPNTKLYYPEPYVASPSFIHNDIWYMHILVYWYWLWFVFIFIIVFFFITFLSCLRWCNPRIQPKRETRGVSRSKCGDLVTATIPVTWAISIIISESADAIDYYDGFNTTELIVGIRAYQWGWEYYYPKDIDLKYSLKPNYNQFIGNSLKYEKKSELKQETNKMFNMMKKTQNNFTNNFSYSLATPTLSNNKVFESNVMLKNSFNSDSSFKNISKFKKISFFNEFQSNFNKNNSLLSFININNNVNYNNFKVLREYNFIPLKSILNGTNNILDLHIINKLTNKNNKINFLTLTEGSNFKKLNSLLFNIIYKKKTFFNLNLFFKNKDKFNYKFLFSTPIKNMDSTSKLTFKNHYLTSNSKFTYNSKLNTFSKDDILFEDNFFKKKKINFFNSNLTSPFLIKESNRDNSLNYSSSKPSFVLNKPMLNGFIGSSFSLKNQSKTFFISENDNVFLLNMWNKNFLTKDSTLPNNNIFKNFEFKNLSNLGSYFLYQDYDFLNKELFKFFDELNYSSIIDLFDLDNLKDLNYNIPKNNNLNFFVNIESNKSFLNLFFKFNRLEQYLSNNKTTNFLFEALNNENKSYFEHNSLIFNNKLKLNLTSAYLNYKSNNELFNNSFKFIKFIQANMIKMYSNFFYIDSYKVFKNNFIIKNLLNNSKINNQSSLNFLSIDKSNLRQSASEMVADYKSLQKVYKLRFDDQRSHLDIKTISNSKAYQLDLNSTMPKFDQILNKNSNKVFLTTTYSIKNLNNNNFYKTYLYNKINNYSFDFPFLISLQSDQSRYIWFDWFSRWSKYEVQQASLAKLGIYGLPKFDKIIEYGASNQGYIDSENYLSRLSISRKNYFVNSRFQSFFENKSSYLNKNLWKFKLNRSNNNSNYFIFLEKIKYDFLNDYTKVNKNLYLNNNESGVNKLGKNFIKTNNLTNNISKLNDLSTKKEFAMKSLLLGNNITPLLPNSYSSNNLNFLNKNLTSLNFDNNFSAFSYEYSLKNQYSPIKRGISNMIRIQASNMVALPVEMRIQVLASSRDIIHSWAIPSAGIKIDCIPGYSSHRVLFFMLSGIYWGQCMEICGRYHHWMPIIIYFMKRDLFFLWCSHFVLSDKNSYINNYSNNNNYFKKTPISFSKSYN